MHNTTIGSEVEDYANEFIECMVQRIKTRYELRRFLHAISRQISKTENSELRAQLQEISRRITEGLHEPSSD